MDVLVGNDAPPAMYQNKFVVLSCKSQIRVATYGFIGAPAVGDRPDQKATPYALRMLSSNLLQGWKDGKSEADSVEYAVRRTDKVSMREIMEEDLARMSAAVSSGDFSQYLRAGRAPPQKRLAARRLARASQDEELRGVKALKQPQKR